MRILLILGGLRNGYGIGPDKSISPRSISFFIGGKLTNACPPGDCESLQDWWKPTIQLDKKPTIIVREPDTHANSDRHQSNPIAILPNPDANHWGCRAN